ncbi:asparaginase domain-containing protein [Microbacterium sp. LWH7-1.2]|uniref:asparaginase n=1 Tax=Microbacterium sp. LWH7-1.2 TaxID=3135257 RepID=UPI00313994D7
MTGTGSVVVIATGGTIASRRDEDGASRPVVAGGGLLAGMEPAAPVRVVDVMAHDSATLTLSHMQRISDAVGKVVSDPDTRGVVILHGTDSLEETALLLALQHGGSDRRIVVTGAQFTFDDPEPDGPANIEAAIRFAADGPPRAARRGRDARDAVCVVFGGRVLPAWGVYKHSADTADAFRVAGPDLAVPPSEPTPVDGVRIDIVALPPGADALHIRASAAAGAHGIVLQALGSGNSTAEVVAAVRECVASGIPVVVSSRVPQGALAPSYGGGGGGRDLAEAGAVHSSTLRPGQARILLAALVARGAEAAEVRAAFG